MRKATILLLLILGAATSARGQTAADLGAKYRVFPVYEVRPDVWMTPKFTADGQVCEIVLEKRHTHTEANRTTISSDPFFSEAFVRDLVEDLVPKSERGKQATGWPAWFNTTISGNSSETVYTYENILVSVYGVVSYPGRDLGYSGDVVVIVSWRKRECSPQGEPLEPAARGSNNPSTYNWHANLERANSERFPLPKAGAVVDEATAIRIGEAVLLPVYGAEHINMERPLHARLERGIWTILGTLPPNVPGGTVIAKIRRKDGRILEMGHSL